MHFTQESVEALLAAWPRLRRLPSSSAYVCSVAGQVAFSMKPLGRPRIEDTYTIRIDVPLIATEQAPAVYEEGGRIARTVDNHVYPLSGALCLGSPWRVRRELGRPPSLINLVDRCVVPFLYAATWRERGNAHYPFSELAHGTDGLVEDYERILGVRGQQSVQGGLKALSLRKRDANKLPCPCGCGGRLGRCSFRLALNQLRVGATRRLFRELRRQLDQSDVAMK